MVVFPWRQPSSPEATAQEMNASGPAEWFVAKNRGGTKGPIAVMWHPEFTRFDSLTDEDGRE